MLRNVCKDGNALALSLTGQSREATRKVSFAVRSQMPLVPVQYVWRDLIRRLWIVDIFCGRVAN